MVKHKLISDLSPDGIVVFDENGLIEYINDSFRELTGYTSQSLVGVDESEFNSAIAALCEPGTSLDERFAESEDSGGIIISQITPVTRSLCCFLRSPGDEGNNQRPKVIFFRAMSEDIDSTNPRRNDYLSVAGHKLRTPLVSILGFSELLLKRDFEAERQRELIATIYRQSDIFKKMLDNFLTLERLETDEGRSFTFKEGTLEQVVNDVIAEFNAIETDSRPEIKLDAAANWARVSFDYEKIKQVISNLVSNAINFSPDNNTVSVKTLLNTDNGDTAFGLSVCDEGIGISNSNMKHIGERFYRVDELQSVLGGGLGLAIVKTIMSIHNGRLEITSEKGEGTTATIWLKTSS